MFSGIPFSIESSSNGHETHVERAVLLFDIRESEYDLVGQLGYIWMY